jgi:hypothetical protein
MDHRQTTNPNHTHIINNQDTKQKLKTHKKLTYPFPCYFFINYYKFKNVCSIFLKLILEVWNCEAIFVGSLVLNRNLWLVPGF